MKKLIVFLIFALIFTVNVRAEESYKEQYNISGAEEIYGLFPPSSEEFINSLDIDMENANWVEKLSAQSVFSQIMEFLKTGLKTPLMCGGGMLAVMLIIAAANTFEGFKPFRDVASYVFTLCGVSGVLLPMFSLINSCASAVKGISVLMDGFVPLYAGILTVSGKGSTATGMSFLLLAAAGLVGSLSSFVIVPLMSCYLGVGVVGSVMPLGTTSRIGDGIKKAALWLLSLILTVFLGILSVQTCVNKAADNLGLKTVRFMIGSFIPVAGDALSESLGTLLGSMGLLKSSVGMFAVVAIAAAVLPLVIEMLIWRLILFLLDIISGALGLDMKKDVLYAADSVIAVLIGVLLFVAALFIISLGIIAGGS